MASLWLDGGGDLGHLLLELLSSMENTPSGATRAGIVGQCPSSEGGRDSEMATLQGAPLALDRPVIIPIADQPLAEEEAAAEAA